LHEFALADALEERPDFHAYSIVGFR
jgi:hypothetical protein